MKVKFEKATGIAKTEIDKQIKVLQAKQNETCE